MANKLYDETSIQAIATAIRGKNGSSDSYTVGQMAQAISDISGLSTYTFTEKLIFAQDGIGASEWRDTTDTTSLTVRYGTYTAVEGEKVVVDATNTLRMAFPADDAYYLFGIKCKIDSNFSPRQTDWWYTASCILGTELGGEQKDYAIIIDKNGYFALGWATSSITSSSVSALDGQVHELLILATQEKILLFIDGNKEVEVFKVMNGSIMTQLGVFWNNGDNNTLVNGEIYSIGCWSYTEPAFDYNLPSF